MQGLVGLDLRAGRGATMARARFEEAVGPEARPYLRSLEPHPHLITPVILRAAGLAGEGYFLSAGGNSHRNGFPLLVR